MTATICSFWTAIFPGAIQCAGYYLIALNDIGEVNNLVLPEGIPLDQIGWMHIRSLPLIHRTV